jgi:hypothetical protein
VAIIEMFITLGHKFSVKPAQRMSSGCQSPAGDKLDSRGKAQTPEHPVLGFPGPKQKILLKIPVALILNMTEALASKARASSGQR